MFSIAAYRQLSRFVLNLPILAIAYLSSNVFAKDQQPAPADQTEVRTVVMWQRNFEAPFMHDMVQNILRLSRDKFGPVLLLPSRRMEQGRAFDNLVDKRKVDLFIGGIDTNREQQAQAIYIPLDRGLLGVRVCLMKKGTRVLTNSKSIDILKKNGFSVGTGKHWPDKQIFEHHGIDVVASPTYKNLFSMLANNRFQCFSRSLAEVEQEYIKHQKSGIEIDSNLAFVYPFGEFAFVNKEDAELYRRMKYGLRKAIEDGSYYRIFNQYYEHNITQYDLFNRNIIKLENPNLSPEARDSLSKYGVGNDIFTKKIIHARR